MLKRLCLVLGIGYVLGVIGILNLPAAPEPKVRSLWSGYELQLRSDGVIVVVDVRQGPLHNVDITNKTDRLGPTTATGEPIEEAAYHAADAEDDRTAIAGAIRQSR